MQGFEKQVQDARRLLNFAAAEGLAVSEATIRIILETEAQLAATSTTPDGPPDIPLEQRIAFQTAYCNLVTRLHPLTQDSLFLSFHLLRYVRLGIMLLFGALWLLKNVHLPFFSISISNFDLLLYGTGISFALWFCEIFTGEMTKKRTIEIVLFCYVFTLFSMLILVYPLFFGEDDTAMYRRMREGPIGLVKGCGRESGDDWIAMEVRCGVLAQHSAPTQWVFNIGGILQRLADTEDLYEISGGVIVPVYVIFLSFMGAVVNMTRRVPEYQRRVSLPSDAPGRLSREQGRELLVFQIMQVLSAPLIAITTYYLIKSESITTSVLISFGSGFASETVLHTISVVVTRLNHMAASSSLPTSEPAARAADSPLPRQPAGDHEIPASNGATTPSPTVPSR